MSYTVALQTLERQPVASIRLTLPPDALDTTLGDLLLEVWDCLAAQQVTAAGPPFLRYHHAEPAQLDIEVGFPATAPVAPRGRVRPSVLPGGPAATTWHHGAPDTLRAAYEALAAWLAAHGYPVVGAPWERYWSDPLLEPDPRAWRTEVVWPLP
jgi:effector-binding domain-containing protein